MDTPLEPRETPFARSWPSKRFAPSAPLRAASGDGRVASAEGLTTGGSELTPTSAARPGVARVGALEPVTTHTRDDNLPEHTVEVEHHLVLSDEGMGMVETIE
jgi:hypothetical protein